MNTEERIATLIVRQLKGDLNNQEADELNSWIDSSEANRNLFKQLTDPDFLQPEVSDFYQSHKRILKKIQAAITPKVIPLWKKLSAVAAAILLLFVGGYWWLVVKNNQGIKEETVKTKTVKDFAPGKEGAILTLADGRKIILDSAANGSLTNQGGVSVNKKGGQVLYEGSGEVLYNTMTTPKGRQYTVVLADGSKVLLNAASSIRFPTSFPGKERVVEITGEAYFEVAKDATKKFVVIAGDMRTEVLGTHFTINSYADEEKITTTLLEGSIKVLRSAQDDKGVVLQPGGQAQINKDGGLTTNKNANLEEATGWINGYFYFEKADVRTVMRQLVRWYDIDVAYKGKVTSELFGGKIQRNLNLSEVMEILKTIGVEYKVEGKTLIIGS